MAWHQSLAVELRATPKGIPSWFIVDSMPRTTSWATSSASRATMIANRRSDTGPELALRSALHREGYRFRKDLRIDLGPVKVRPDIVFTRRKIAIFIDGCFWHRCPIHQTSIPKSNTEYWSEKFTRNVNRDLLQTSALVEAGWRVLRIWEHVPVAQALQRIAEELRS